jgi:hypothetical protein
MRDQTGYILWSIFFLVLGPILGIMLRAMTQRFTGRGGGNDQ